MSFILLSIALVSTLLPSIASSSIACNLCKASVNKLNGFAGKNSTEQKIDILAKYICEAVRAEGECTGFPNSWQCKEVCTLACKTYSSELNYLIGQYFNADIICYNLHNNIFGCPQPSPTPKPTPLPNKLIDNETRNNSGVGYFIQIPDIHWDPQFVVNAVANCGEPICCRQTDDTHNYTGTLLYSGMYGIAVEGIMCDAPWTVLTSMYTYIEQKIMASTDIDFVVFVGDAAPHDVYNQTKETHIQIMKDLISQMKLTFDDIPVFVDVGNHEGLPVDNFGGPSIDQWFNSQMGDMWSTWIDTPYSKYDELLPSAVMSASGYYSTVIHPGLRLIAINTGYIQPGNFYISFSHNKEIDMGGQYAWLQSVFESARVLNESVILMQHFPVNAVLDHWKQLYYNLYTKYSDILLFILSGHTHNDEYRTLGSFNADVTEFNASNAYAVQFIDGSITTYNGRNPCFRMYEYDRVSNEILNIYHYRMDIQQSNVEQSAVWSLAYDMKSEYGMKDMSAVSFTELAVKFVSDDGLWKKFENHYHNGVAYNSSLNRNSTVCNLISVTSNEYNYCIGSMFKSKMSLEEYQKSLL